MLLIIVASVAAIIVLLLIIASLKAKTFRYERRTLINAAPEKVFSIVNDFHNWPSWSPWEKIDPAMNRKHSGAAAGKGAVYEWDGNKKAGSGKMEIVEDQPAQLVKIKLTFLRPFPAQNTAEFVLVPQGGKTEITWAMYGAAPFMNRLAGVFINFDQLIGKDFERGLASVKQIVEAQ
jgi:uncharacterized protein YndB with AHSA1/START domain